MDSLVFSDDISVHGSPQRVLLWLESITLAIAFYGEYDTVRTYLYILSVLHILAHMVYSPQPQANAFQGRQMHALH